MGHRAPCQPLAPPATGLEQPHVVQVEHPDGQRGGIPTAKPANRQTTRPEELAATCG